MTANGIIPLAVSPNEARAFAMDMPLLYELGVWWSTHGPRARGALPRLLGRTLLANCQGSIRTRGGARLAIAPEHLDIYTTISRKGGVWEQHVVETCLALLADGETFLDIGANAGYVSVEVASLIHGATVYAFEPLVVLARAIAQSAALNQLDRLKVLPAVVTDHEGSEQLFVGSHAIHASSVAREEQSQAVTCPAVTLDGLLAQGIISAPSVIKVDVEGAERAVFAGARALLREHQPALVFEADANLDRFGYGRDDLIDDLRQVVPDYRFFGLSAKGSRPLESCLDDPAVDNVVAVTDRHVDRLERGARLGEGVSRARWNLSGISRRGVVGRALRAPLRFIPETAEVRVLQGPLRGARWLAGATVHGAWLGSFEIDKQALIARWVDEGAVFYDVGANVGVYTLLASRRVGPTGTVHAFEPVPRNLRFLRRHLELNRLENVTVHPNAVSDQPGTARFDTTEGHSQGRLADEGELEVEVVSIDGVVDAGRLPAPGVIKIDVEGAEEAVLQGAARTIRRSGPVVFVATHGAEEHRRTIALLRDWGYDVQPIDAATIDQTDELVAYPPDVVVRS